MDGGGRLKFNVDLKGNSCITSHRKHRARRRPPSASVYNNPQPFTKVWKEREEKKTKEKADAEIKLAKRPKKRQNSRCRDQRKQKSSWIFFVFSVRRSGFVGGSPSTPATAPSLHHHYTLPKLPSCNVRFDLSLGRPCKTNNGRC